MKKLFLFCCISFIITSCNVDIEEHFIIQDEVNTICATIKDFEFEQSDFSRTSITIEEDGPHYAWAQTDTIGIFPSAGRQVEFSMASGAGSTSATFTGGGWGLKSTSTYAAYFPLIGKYYLDKTQIPVTYEKQKQIGNGTTSHLGTYDYLAAPAAEVKNGGVSFMFERLGALLRIQFDVPDDMLLMKAQLTTLDDNFITKGYLDLTNTTPKIDATTATYSKAISLDLSISAKKSDKVTLYMMIAPANLSDKELYLSVENSAGYVYKAPIVCNTKNFEAGKAYALSGKIVQERNAKLIDGPTFNSTIKSLCTNGQVKSVKFNYSTTTIPSSYKIVSVDDSDYPVYASASYGYVTISTEADKLILNENSLDMFYNLDITSIDVSNLITDNVINMGGMFAWCEKLTTLDLRSFNTRKVTNMFGMFRDCKALTSINLEGWVTDKVTSMTAMFNMCTSLQSLELSHFKTNNVTEMYNMFCYCSSLTELNLDTFDTANVTDMTCMFQGCNALSSLDLKKFNTQKVTSMRYMFSDCSNLMSLDLSSFDTKNVTNMECMFYNTFDSFTNETKTLNLGTSFVISSETNYTNIVSDMGLYGLITITCLPDIKSKLKTNGTAIWINAETGESIN